MTLGSGVLPFMQLARLILRPWIIGAGAAIVSGKIEVPWFPQGWDCQWAGSVDKVCSPCSGCRSALGFRALFSLEDLGLIPHTTWQLTAICGFAKFQGI